MKATPLSMSCSSPLRVPSTSFFRQSLSAILLTQSSVMFFFQASIFVGFGVFQLHFYSWPHILNRIKVWRVAGQLDKLDVRFWAGFSKMTAQCKNDSLNKKPAGTKVFTSGTVKFCPLYLPVHSYLMKKKSGAQALPSRPQYLSKDQPSLLTRLYMLRICMYLYIHRYTYTHLCIIKRNYSCKKRSTDHKEGNLGKQACNWIWRRRKLTK